jgi:hypothetical protein
MYGLIKMFSLPIEIINKILIFRPTHPLAKIFQESIRTQCVICREPSLFRGKYDPSPIKYYGFCCDTCDMLYISLAHLF